MRQREQIEQSWEVRYPTRTDGCGEMRLWSRHDSSKEAHSVAREARAGGIVGVRVVRDTRYRLAPLVEIAAWRIFTTDGWAKCGGAVGDGTTSAIVYVDDRSAAGKVTRWRWEIVATGAEVAGCAKTKRAAIAAAEAALAVLGFKVAEEKS